MVIAWCCGDDGGGGIMVAVPIDDGDADDDDDDDDMTSLVVVGDSVDTVESSCVTDVIHWHAAVDAESNQSLVNSLIMSE